MGFVAYSREKKKAHSSRSIDVRASARESTKSHNRKAVLHEYILILIYGRMRLGDGVHGSWIAMVIVDS